MAEDEAQDAGQKKPKRRLGQRIHDRLVAAEVAAEESAGFGWATEAVEAAEAAVDPEHELGAGEGSDTGPDQEPAAGGTKPGTPG